MLLWYTTLRYEREPLPKQPDRAGILPEAEKRQETGLIRRRWSFLRSSALSHPVQRVLSDEHTMNPALSAEDRHPS